MAPSPYERSRLLCRLSCWLFCWLFATSPGRRGRFRRAPTVLMCMTMNLLHNRICASAKWEEYVRTSLFPAVLDDVDLGHEVLEIGPGLGVTTRLLAERLGG